MERRAEVLEAADWGLILEEAVVAEEEEVVPPVRARRYRWLTVLRCLSSMEDSRIVSLHPALAILTSKLEACDVAVSNTSMAGDDTDDGE